MDTRDGCSAAAETPNVHPRAIISADAHASLAPYLKFKDTPEIAEWLAGPFYKTVCRVSDQDFARAKETLDHVVIPESALDSPEVAIAFKQRAEYSKFFRFLRLYN